MIPTADLAQNYNRHDYHAVPGTISTSSIQALNAIGYRRPASGKDGNRSTPEDDGAPSPVSIYQRRLGTKADFTVAEFKKLVNDVRRLRLSMQAAPQAQKAQLQDQLAEQARQARDVKNDRDLARNGVISNALAKPRKRARRLIPRPTRNVELPPRATTRSCTSQATAAAKAAYGAAE